MTWKVPVFDMFLCHISAIFEDIDFEILYTYSSVIALSHVVRFLKILFLGGKFLKKKKKLSKILKILRNFQHFKNPR